MDAHELKGCMCEQCGEFTEVPSDPTKLTTKYGCDNCGEIYDKKEDAEKYCDE